MTMRKFLVLAVVLIPTMASAQTQTQTLARPVIDDPNTAAMQSTRDPPRGFPYRTGDYSGGEGGQTAQVPLRDFLSSRQDQQRAELLRLIENTEVWLQRILDERDTQYRQQFASLEQAMLTALATAKEAVLKAENAANERFDAGNEIKAAMGEQATTFMRISTAEARFNALEEKVNSVYDRLNNMQAQGKGSMETWGFMALIAGVLIAGISVAFAIAVGIRDRRPTREPGA